MCDLHGASLRCFSPLTTDDVIDAVRRLPDKFSAADPIPTYVLKQVIDVIAPFVVELFNRSLSEGDFPAVFLQRGVRHCCCVETGTRCYRHQLIPTYFEPVGTVEAPGAPRRQPADEIPDVR